MKGRGNISATIGITVVSAVFLLLSLNYGRTVGLFYTKASDPVVNFATQTEAIMSSMYTSPEEMTVTYDGPPSCTWDEDRGEYICIGGVKINQAGVSNSFTSTDMYSGFPFTVCIYVNIIPLIIKGAKWFGGWVGEAVEKSKIWRGLKNIVKQTGFGRLIKKIKTWFGGVKKFIAKIGPKTLKEVIEESIEEATEKVIKEATEGGIEKLSKEALEEFYEKGLKESQKTILEKAGINNAKKFASDMDSLLSKRVKDLHKGFQETITNAFLKNNDEAWSAFSTLLIERNGILKEWGESAASYFLKNGGISAVRKTRLKLAKERAGWLTSKLKWVRYRMQETIKSSVRWVSCGNENPLMSLADIFFNGQFVLKLRFKQFSHFYSFYMGKTGSININYELEGSDTPMMLNKLYLVDGSDMCAQREYLSEDMTDYGYQSLPNSDGTITFEKNKGLFETTCSESSAFYPKSLGDIVNDIDEIYKNGGTKTINVFVSPAKMISFEGATICEKRIKRTVDGSAQKDEYGNIESFTIGCVDTTNYFGADAPILYREMSIDYWDDSDDLGNEYKQPEAAELRMSFALDSPFFLLAETLGSENTGKIRDILTIDDKELMCSNSIDNYLIYLLLADEEDRICTNAVDCFNYCKENDDTFFQALQKIVTEVRNRDKKEFYFQTRYDMYKLTINKRIDGKLELSADGPYNVMGLNNRGTYTELIKDEWYESLRLST